MGKNHWGEQENDTGKSNTVVYSSNRGRMLVTYNGDSKDVKTKKGVDAKLVNGQEYRCTEKLYHCEMFVNVESDDFEGKVRVPIKELTKVK